MTGKRGAAGSCIVLAWLFILSGCGGPKVVPVRGRVTLDGEPVRGAQVWLISPDGKRHLPFGLTDEQGQFALNTEKYQDGALPGKYKVRVTKFEEVPVPGRSPFARKRKELLPAIYADPKATPLEVEVPKTGLNDYHVELRSRPEAGVR